VHKTIHISKIRKNREKVEVIKQQFTEMSTKNVHRMWISFETISIKIQKKYSHPDESILPDFICMVHIIIAKIWPFRKGGRKGFLKIKEIKRRESKEKKLDGYSLIDYNENSALN
jgi:hypothetical protein